MEKPYLRPVSDDDGPEPPSKPSRSAQRRKPTKPLPTDRVKFDVQVEILRSFARLGSGLRPVNSEQIANANNISVNTAALNNRFYAECGWLERVGRGQYTATDALTNFSRRIGIDAENPGSAIAYLADTARRSWYWRALEPNLRDGALPRSEALVILSSEAETIEEHRPQLENVFLWLEYLGLVRFEGDLITTTDAARVPDNANRPPEMRGEEPNLSRSDDTEPQGSGLGRSGSDPGGSSEVIIAFSTDLRLTRDDLAALSADQIRALFDAVGTVAALTHRQ